MDVTFAILEPFIYLEYEQTQVVVDIMVLFSISDRYADDLHMIYLSIKFWGAKQS